jgi:hypothetical protein
MNMMTKQRLLAPVVFAFVMGIFMSMTVTFLSTYLKLGFVDKFLEIWMESWVVTYPIVVASILIYRPASTNITGRIVNALIKNQKHS